MRKDKTLRKNFKRFELWLTRSFSRVSFFPFINMGDSVAEDSWYIEMGWLHWSIMFYVKEK